MRLALLLVLASGCVTTRPALLDTDAGRAALTARTSGRVATLYAGGERHAVRDLHIGPNETTWVDRISGQPQSAPTSTISAVSVRSGNLWRPILVGAGVGLATGALAAATDADSGFFRTTPAEYLVIFGTAGAVTGSVVGVSRTDRFVPPRRAAIRFDTLTMP